MRVLDLFNLSGKVALIVGGSRHLGYDMAEALAEAGAAVAVTSRESTVAEAAATKLAAAFGVPTVGFSLDHRQHEEVRRVFQATVQKLGRLDILINNAGGGSGLNVAYLLDRDPTHVEDMIATNLTGALHCCQEAARVMCERKEGNIINVASCAAIVGRNRQMYVKNGMLGQPVDYAASKAGVIGMTIDLAALLGPQGIRVNSISPGGFQRSTHTPGFVRDYSERTALGRMGRDGIDIKGAALFLASAASSYVTGHNLVVDGGFSIWH